MSDFPIIPASKKSLAFRKLVHGVGINDAEYMINVKSRSSTVQCPYYRKWAHMIARCYSVKFKERYPTYEGCTVHEDWLTFSNFRSWMITQDWKGKHLDKDIKFSGNKEYSASSCIFVDGYVNTILNSKKANRGELPIGVSWIESKGKFCVCCNVNGKIVSVGAFSSCDAAESAYLEFKSKHVISVAKKQSYPLRSYLERISDEIKRGEYFN